VSAKIRRQRPRQRSARPARRRRARRAARRCERRPGVARRPQDHLQARARAIKGRRHQRGLDHRACRRDRDRDRRAQRRVRPRPLLRLPADLAPERRSDHPGRRAPHRLGSRHGHRPVVGGHDRPVARIALTHELSRGAHGRRLSREDLGLGRPVAIKVLRSDLASDSRPRRPVPRRGRHPRFAATTETSSRSTRSASTSRTSTS